MNAYFPTNLSARSAGLIAVGIVAVILAAPAVSYLPAYWLTLVLGLIVFVVALVYPMAGVSLILVGLYFPIFPNVPLGSFEFSISTLPVAGLALGALVRSRSQPGRGNLMGWQKILLAALGLAFILSSLLSANLGVSLRMAPNLLLYLLILFGIIVEVNSSARLHYVAKLILILAFVVSFWRFELAPLRSLLHLPMLSINGAVFSFHPAVALALAILLFTPGEGFSKRWRWFAGLTLVSLAAHGILNETRAGWLTWLVLLLAVGSRLPMKHLVRLSPLILIVGSLLIISYSQVLKSNISETSATLQGLKEEDQSLVGSDDRIRLLAYDAGVRMFHAKPVLGWGPNLYVTLKPAFVADSSKEAKFLGAFNSWLILLTEMGLVGLTCGALISLAPFAITWYMMYKQPTEINGLAFGFALGALGLAIHLLFIDLMFSFYWVHIGLALAAAGLVLQNRSSIEGDAAESD